MTLLALDGGQSGCRARLDDGAPFDLPGIQTHRSVVDQLAALVRTAAPSGVDVVCIGTTGLGASDTAAALLAQLPPVGEVRLAHDSVTSYLGGLGDRPGCVVAAGTGSIIFAVAVSGYWIGRAALDAVLRAYDGRGPGTALSAPVTADFPELDQMYLALQGDPDRVRRIASYARVVADLAASDEVAGAIVAANVDVPARDLRRRGWSAVTVMTGFRRARRRGDGDQGCFQGCGQGCAEQQGAASLSEHRTRSRQA